MFKKLQSLLRSNTAKDASLMTMGTALSAVLAAVFFILAARLLGPKDFGIFSLATAASFMFADVFDIALNTSLVRFVARSLKNKDELADKYLKLIFKFKTIVAILFIILISLFAKQLSELLLGQEMQTVLLLTAFGAGFQMMYTFTIAHTQAKSQFFKAAIATVLNPGFRLLGLLGLVAAKAVGTLSSLGVYFFATPISALFGILLSPLDFFKEKNENQVAKSLISYNLPLTAGFAITAIAGRIDNFILVNSAGAQAVGFYAAAFRLFAPLQFLAGSMSTVFAPRFAGFTKASEAKVYFKKSLAAVVVLSIGMLFIFPFSNLLIRLFYGQQFTPSVLVLKILLFGFVAFFLQVPFTSVILYYFAKPRVFGIISIIQLVLIVATNFLLAPKYHENGAAIAFLLTQTLVLVIMASYCFIRLTKRPDEND